MAGGRIATRHLIERGDECIGLIRTGQVMLAQEQRKEGYEAVLREAGLLVERARVVRRAREAEKP